MLVLLSVILTFFQSEASLNDRIKSYLDEKLAEHERYDFEVTRLPSNYLKIEIQDFLDPEIKGSLCYVPVKIQKTKTRSRTSFITVRLHIYDYVYVANADIDRKDDLNYLMFDKKLMEVSDYAGNFVAQGEDLQKFRARRMIRSGAVLLNYDIEKIPDILAGDKITALSNVGNVVVSVEAYAREDGAEGEIIKVRTVDNKIFQARVIDNKNVIIIE